MTYATGEDSDQPGHPPSLIRVFAVNSVGSWGPNISSCGQRRLIRLDGCLGWSVSSLGAFLSKRAHRWLIKLWIRRALVSIWDLLRPCLCFFFPVFFFPVILTILRSDQHYYICIEPFIWRAWEGMVNQLSECKDSNNKVSRAHLSSHRIIYASSIVNDISTFAVEDHMLDWQMQQTSTTIPLLTFWERKKKKKKNPWIFLICITFFLFCRRQIRLSLLTIVYGGKLISLDI